MRLQYGHGHRDTHDLTVLIQYVALLRLRLGRRTFALGMCLQRPDAPILHVHVAWGSSGRKRYPEVGQGPELLHKRQVVRKCRS